ncbi:ferroxidase fet3 [Coemansia sp. RSA 1933]|nr:ferroxidase fet3 [Coemansia sp. RSA 1933]
MLVVSLFVLVASVAQVAIGANIFIEWDVGYITVNRDGNNTRRAISVNGALPIPPIKATKGDTLHLTVHNSLDVTTSIHAHGLFQNGTNHMDGAAMITQCGIPPKKSFTYVYHLAQAGTYWIHGHDHSQNSDGLRTAFLIYDDDKPPYDYEKDILMTLEDWFREEFTQREKETLDPKNEFPPPHGYGFGLINGINGNYSESLHFEPGKTYRIRLINMGRVNWFKFRLPGHRMRVIEVDGVYTEPLEVDVIDISPAQRYSVLVTAHDTYEFNYNFNATLHADFIPAAPGLIPRLYIGDIIYREDAPFKHIPSVDESELVWLNDINLIPLDREEALPVDRVVRYNVGNALVSTDQHLDFFNNVTFALPKIPSLYTAQSLGDLAMDSRVYGPQTNALILKHNEVVEFTFNNREPLPHPFHMHGHTFQVTEYGPAELLFDDPRAPKNISTVHATGPPVRRDTMVVPGFHYIKFRIRADNPGVWLFHCHLDIHFVLGMGMVIIEAPDVLQERQKVPQLMYELCRQQNIPVSGNAAGNGGLDFTGLPVQPAIVNTNTTSP